jgi:uncharacterized membrane protein YbjE (DUF340 family)
MKLKLFAGALVVNIVTISGAFALDPGLPVYQVVPGISVRSNRSGPIP